MDKQLQDKILSVMSQSELGRRLGKKPQTVEPLVQRTGSR